MGPALAVSILKKQLFLLEVKLKIKGVQRRFLSGL